MEKDSILMGIVLGAIVPVLGYLAIEAIFNLMSQMDLMEVVSGGAMSRRVRTLALLGICCNLIPFNIAKRNRWDDTLRGIVFPTLIYVAAWCIKYLAVLF